MFSLCGRWPRRSIASAAALPSEPTVASQQTHLILVKYLAVMEISVGEYPIDAAADGAQLGDGRLFDAHPAETPRHRSETTNCAPFTSVPQVWNRNTLWNKGIHVWINFSISPWNRSALCSQAVKWRGRFCLKCSTRRNKMCSHFEYQPFARNKQFDLLLFILNHTQNTL